MDKILTIEQAQDFTPLRIKIYNYKTAEEITSYEFEKQYLITDYIQINNTHYVIIETVFNFDTNILSLYVLEDFMIYNTFLSDLLISKRRLSKNII